MPYLNRLRISFLILSNLSLISALPLIPRAKDQEEDGLYDQAKDKSYDWWEENKSWAQVVVPILTVVLVIYLFCLWRKSRREKAEQAAREMMAPKETDKPKTEAEHENERLKKGVAAIFGIISFRQGR